jgi:tRNA 2-thiouridine synthesizing protein A
MSEVKVIDARGLSCPHPVLLARDAIKFGAGSLLVLVDAGTARDNVTRLAERSGWRVQVEDVPGGEFRLMLTK